MLKLTDQTALADVAEHTREAFIRMAAADVLNDKILAKRIYMKLVNNEKQEVCEAA